MLLKLDKKIITAIMDQYGGMSHYNLNEKLHGDIVYDDKRNPGAVLSIGVRYDKKDSTPYIEANLTDNRGKIIRSDCYEILFGTDLYWKSSKKKGQDMEYPDEKIAYVGQGKRKPRQELEKDIRTLMKKNNMLMEQNDRILKNTEQEYLNSWTYCEMQEKIDFLESIVKLDKAAIANAEARIQKSTQEITQIYEDNKRLVEHHADTDYFVGITENWHAAWEYEKLQSEINRLKGHISANTVLLIQREDEIKRLQGVVGSLKKELQSQEKVPNIETESSLQEKIAKMEKEIIKTKENLPDKRKKRGKKPEKMEESKEVILELYKKGYTIRDIAGQTGLSIGWVHETLKRNT